MRPTEDKNERIQLETGGTENLRLKENVADYRHLREKKKSTETAADCWVNQLKIVL